MCKVQTERQSGGRRVTTPASQPQRVRAVQEVSPPTTLELKT